MAVIGDLFGLSDPQPWAVQALCAQIGDDSLWFPNVGNKAHAAVKVCESCPVMVECREYAIESPVVLHGIWEALGLEPVRLCALSVDETQHEPRL
jgi:hypothetical protein